MSIRLDQFETGKEIDRDAYEPRLADLQRELQQIQAAYIQQGLKAVVAIEGWDAAGKGGLISASPAAGKSRFSTAAGMGACWLNALTALPLRRSGNEVMMRSTRSRRSTLLMARAS
jgi:hypothetical protein